MDELERIVREAIEVNSMSPCVHVPNVVSALREADVAVVRRCKDCGYWGKQVEGCCDWWHVERDRSDYCSDFAAQGETDD